MSDEREMDGPDDRPRERSGEDHGPGADESESKADRSRAQREEIVKGRKQPYLRGLDDRSDTYSR